MARVQIQMKSLPTLVCLWLNFYFVSGHVNLALNKPASMSSVSVPMYRAGMAVDGSHHNRRQKDASCAITKPERTTWWQVDLHDMFVVTSIHITKRTEDDFVKVTVMVYSVNPVVNSSEEGKVCGSSTLERKSDTARVDCTRVIEGRYLRIVKKTPSPTILCLCEVQVYGKIPFVPFLERFFTHRVNKAVIAPYLVMQTKSMMTCGIACSQLAGCTNFALKEIDRKLYICKLAGILGRKTTELTDDRDDRVFSK